MSTLQEYVNFSLIDIHYPTHWANVQVEFKLVYGPGTVVKVTDFMTIYRILVGKMTLGFNFNIHVLVNTW